MTRDEFYRDLLKLRGLFDFMNFKCKEHNYNKANFDKLYDHFSEFSSLFDHWLECRNLHRKLDDLADNSELQSVKKLIEK